METIESKLDRINSDIELHNKLLDDVIKKFIFSPATLSIIDLNKLYV